MHGEMCKRSTLKVMCAITDNVDRIFTLLFTARGPSYQDNILYPALNPGVLALVLRPPACTMNNHASHYANSDQLISTERRPYDYLLERVKQAKRIKAQCKKHMLLAHQSRTQSRSMMRSNRKKSGQVAITSSD